MPLAKCVRCKNIFNKDGNAVCEACLPDEDADFELIRDAVKDNADVNAERVAELTGVSVDCVLRMLETGLISSEATIGTAAVKCGRCGKPAISATKRLCQGCLEKLNQEVVNTRKSIQLSTKKGVEIGGATHGMATREGADDARRK